MAVLIGKIRAEKFSKPLICMAYAIRAHPPIPFALQRQEVSFTNAVREHFEPLSFGEALTYALEERGFARARDMAHLPPEPAGQDQDDARPLPEVWAEAAIGGGLPGSEWSWRRQPELQYSPRAACWPLPQLATTREPYILAAENLAETIVASIDELRPLVAEPREDMAAEYKSWLNLAEANHKAVLAKAAIAIANHGGGYIIIGMRDDRAQLVSVPCPNEIPATAQDAVNAAIQRYATPEFHCEVYVVPHPETGVVHPVIVVPGGMTEPVMSKRDCLNVIAQNRVYIRKPGPRSEEPQTGEEWRGLLRRCVQNGREDMLDSIRAIVSGRAEPVGIAPNAAAELHGFAESGRRRWAELVADLPENDEARFPHGYYEMAFKLIGAEPAPTLVELRNRLQVAQRIRLTGWTTFLEMNRPEWAPYLHEEFIEAWVGRKVDGQLLRTSAHCDFWRAARDGKLYTIRGYSEDGIANKLPAGAALDVTMPVWRVGEGLLFASRLAETFEGAESIAIECTFTGLLDRYLTSVDGVRAIFDDRHSRTDAVTLVGQPTVRQVRDNLAEVMQALLSPLYERFDFFEAPFQLFDAELNKLRGGRF